MIRVLYLNRTLSMPHAPCPMPHAPCPMPHAQFPCTVGRLFMGYAKSQKFRCCI
ncbi:hypothetical protein H6G81_03550 [Scytonema hofmannii FACHB-248]|uniref:Uncharacterized protein n=1 Tax=Scytonema hofmannii FACHB-248 TaxID=1842502 RepID=A0ABR8GKE5_9CYAN|nr:hypothetical protein [Scytonema hofmannii]MBD2603625.1 hypothetical protein [Scytonema hofmannii FACHB-248]